MFDEDLLWNIHKEFVQKVNDQMIGNHRSEILANTIYELMPEPGDFSSILASSALDAASVLSEMNNFLQNKSTKAIQDISIMAFDSVDMYIQEIEDLPAKFDESMIDNHPLMLKEISFQQSLIENIKKEGLETFDKYQNLQGSLELDWMLTDTDEKVVETNATDQLTIEYPEGFAEIIDDSFQLKNHFIAPQDAIYGNKDQSVLIGVTFNKGQTHKPNLVEYIEKIKQEINQNRLAEWEPEERRLINGNQSVLLSFYSGSDRERVFTMMCCILYKEKLVILTFICKDVQTMHWKEKFQECLDSIHFG